MKKPMECDSIDDIREAIDGIDKKIVALIAKRASYVTEAVKYKTSSDAVRAEERVQKMLGKRREWAEQYGISPDFIASLYQNIVNHFINEEMANWKNRG